MLCYRLEIPYDIQDIKALFIWSTLGRYHLIDWLIEYCRLTKIINLSEQID